MKRFLTIIMAIVTLISVTGFIYLAQKKTGYNIVILKEGNMVELGKSFKAKIYLIKSLPATAELRKSDGNGKITKFDDSWEYSAIGSSEGENSFGGNVILKNGNNIDTLSFSDSYFVMRPSCLITTNLPDPPLVKDTENSIYISCPGVPSNNLVASSDNGIIKKDPKRAGLYKITPIKLGKCIVVVKSVNWPSLQISDSHDLEVVEKK